MKDIEKMLEKSANKEVEIPLKIHYRIQHTLKNKNNNVWKLTFRKIVQILVTLILTLITSTGMVWAGSQIYNEYIKSQGTIKSIGLFQDENNTYNTEIIEDMEHDKQTDMYYKAITSSDEYYNYKEDVADLPEMTEQDFKDYFVVIVAWYGKLEEHKKDLRIVSVTTDENTTYITIRQCSSPDYENENNIVYAIIGKEQLRENIKVHLDNKEVSSPDFLHVQDLPKDYSIQDAINDGCLVVENNILKCPDLSVIDDFIANTEAEQKDFIRIYEKYNYTDLQGVVITDIQFENGVYHICSYDSNECTPKYHSSKNFKRLDWGKSIRYCWDVKIFDNGYSGIPIVEIRK